MPIYEYRCNVCGHQEEHLQKVSEPPLTVCPACGKPEYRKQLSAAGFQLKGTGWYATDFKGGSKKPAEKKADTKSDSKSDSKGDSKTESKPETKTESKAAA
ncbi:MAG: zinc ribbon domain-containing protein [Betaproteobacteria bacterium]|nr:MAG: zinc ribbon domain-containing protein [Betaproteobacteria bacterium]